MRRHFWTSLMLGALILSLSSAAQFEDGSLTREWIVTCKISSCTQAFETALDSKCSGLKQCKSAIDKHFPHCSMCFAELMDRDSLETINGVEMLICTNEENIQSLGCHLFCRVNWYTEGRCVRKGNIPICECSNTDSLTRLSGYYDSLIDHSRRNRFPCFIPSLYDESTIIDHDTIGEHSGSNRTQRPNNDSHWSYKYGSLFGNIAKWRPGKWILR